MGRVSCQVEKDVDAVGADLLRQPLVAHAEHVPPVGRGGLKTMRQVVLDGCGRSNRSSRTSPSPPAPLRKARGEAALTPGASPEGEGRWRRFSKTRTRK